MASSDSVAVFVPILYLLVVELANISRETVDLAQLAEEDLPAFQILKHRRLWGHTILPNLGRFLFIQWASMMLLAMAAFVALTFLSGILQAGLLFATSILLYTYPVFEVSEYDHLLKRGRFPDSYGSHLAFISVLIALIAATPVVLFLIGESFGRIYFALIFVFVPFLSARAFTIRLSKELRE